MALLGIVNILLFFQDIALLGIVNILFVFQDIALLGIVNILFVFQDIALLGIVNILFVFQDIALLGIVNILYNSGRLEDALLVCDMALHADNNLVATHFTMANIYAAKVSAYSGSCQYFLTHPNR